MQTISNTLILAFCCLITFMVGPAHAVVVDNFSCNFSFTSNTAKIADFAQAFEMHSIRLPMAEADKDSGKEFGEIQYTEAKNSLLFEMSVEHSDKFLVEFNFRYVHALRANPLPESRVARCLNVSIYASGYLNEFSCPDISKDPFGDTTGAWAKATVLNGVPRFPVRLWKFYADPPEGHFELTCAIKETLP